jgi:hypothetical protein
VRRLIASLALVAFVAACAAPAIAACRMRSAQRACCCKPAPANSLCQPDCCQIVRAARPVADLSRHVRTLYLFADPPTVLTLGWLAPASSTPAPARGQVGLHQRAAPRLPLRI